MAIAVRSFAKINIGLRIGSRREDGFHELRTIYQTVALADTVRVDAGRGVGIEIYCKDQRVPADESNTCWRIADRFLRSIKTRAKVKITIEKNLPVQGGLGGASSNAIATLLGLERVMKKQLAPEERLRLASEVGSDLPLFLIGGTVLGTGRGEQVFPMEDLPSFPCVIATPQIGISTPLAFSDWDKRKAEQPELTSRNGFCKMSEFSHSVYEWFSSTSYAPTGVPRKGWDRAEALLLDLVRTGIENDFESVVFPKYPAIREVKRALEKSGARYVSLSGSGSTVYGLFAEKAAAEQAARLLNDTDIAAQATATLTRTEYWNQLFAKNS